MPLFHAKNAIIAGKLPVKFSSIITVETGSIVKPRLARLTDTTAALLYQSTSNRPQIRHLSALDTDTPVVGSVVQVASNGSSSGMSIIRVSDTSCYVAYHDSVGGELKANLITSMNTTPSIGTQHEIDSAGLIGPRGLALMNSTAVVAVYFRAGTYYIRDITAITTTPVISGETTLRTGGGNRAGIVFLTATTIAFGAEVTASTAQVVFRVTDVLGTPTVGTETSVDTGTTAAPPTLTFVNSTVVHFSYPKSSQERLVKITSLDGTPALGSIYTFPANHDDLQQMTTGDNKAVCMLIDVVGTDFPEIHRIRKLDGTPEEQDQTQIVNANYSLSPDSLAFEKLTNNRAVFVGIDLDDSNDGKVIVARNL